VADPNFDVHHRSRLGGAGKPSILIHILEAIGAIAEHSRTYEQRKALSHHARLVMRAGEREITEPDDLKDIERQFRSATSALARAASYER
jgi:uncharacterized membrane protein